MTQRRYTLDEIDRMRRAIFYIWHPSGAVSFTSRSDGDSDRMAREDELRTYMANGTDPHELERAAEACRPQYRLENV